MVQLEPDTLRTQTYVALARHSAIHRVLAGPATAPGSMCHFLFGMRACAIEHDRAQDVVEYGLIIATIAVVILLGITAFGAEIRPWFEFLAGRITTIGT